MNRHSRDFLVAGGGLSCITPIYRRPCAFTIEFPIETGYRLCHAPWALVGQKKIEAAAGSHLESRLRILHLVYKII